MVKDKTDDIRQTGAARLITGDCGCLMNISGAMQHDKIRIGGQHLAEFIWERINDQPLPA
jgi:L-lactate dehydrogenase complex protein LldE